MTMHTMQYYTQVLGLYDPCRVHTLRHLDNLIHVHDIQVKWLIFRHPSAMYEVCFVFGRTITEFTYTPFSWYIYNTVVIDETDYTIQIATQYNTIYMSMYTETNNPNNGVSETSQWVVSFQNVRA